MRQKPQEDQRSHLSKVMTTNSPPTSQDKSSAIPSAYDEFLTIHKASKKTDLPRRSDTLPSPANGPESDHVQKPFPPTPQDVSRRGSGQLQEMNHLATQGVPSLLPSDTSGATIASLKRVTWDTSEWSAEPAREEAEPAPSLPKLPPQPSIDDIWRSKDSSNANSELSPWLSNDSIVAAVSQPEEGSGNHNVQDAIRPFLTTVETAPPSTSRPNLEDKSTQPPNLGYLSFHDPQSSNEIPSLTDNMSRVSLLTANTADSATNSRDSSLFSKGSSVWTADSALTSSSTHFDPRDTPLPAATLSSVYSIRRKPLGSIKSHGNSPPSTSTSLPQVPIDEHAAVASVTRRANILSPTALQNVEAFSRSSSRHPSWSSETDTDIHLDKKAASSTSSAGVSALNPSKFDVNKPGVDGSPLLVRAASDGLAEMVEKLLASGAHIEAVHTKTKRNALIEASVQGHSRVVNLLLDHRCSLQRLDSQHMSALHHAAEKGHLLVAKALLDRGAAVDIQDSDGLTPLYLASRASHANMVMLLLQRQANVNARDASQQTALHVAASRGFPNVCNSLLDHGAQSESRDGNSKTPMQLAIAAEHREVAELLLARSTLRPTDTNFLTAFFGAIETGHVRMVESFLDKGATLKGLKNDAYKPATLAAKSGNPEMVTLLLRHRAKFREKDSNGWTALHFAAHYGHTLVIEQLSDREIPSNTKTTKKETPLHLAVAVGHFGAVDCLLRNKGGLCVSSKDIRGEEPLHQAARAGSTEIVNLLFSHKASINAENNFGCKPLHIAVAYGNAAIVEQLVNLGASIEEKTGSTEYKKAETHSLVDSGYWAEAHWPFPGSKPLHLAVEFGYDDIARFLLRKGAKVDSACGEGWRPLHLAAFYASPVTVDLLLQRNASPHSVTDMARGRTPLEVARHRSQSQTLPGSISPSEKDRVRVQELLHAAMASVPKRPQDHWKQMKVIVGKGPDEKGENLRAAVVAMEVTGKGPTLGRHASIPRHGALGQQITQTPDG